MVLTIVFVDSNVFIQLLYGDPRADEAEGLLAKYYFPATCVGVVDEELHFTIRKEAKDKYNVVKAYALRKLLKKSKE